MKLLKIGAVGMVIAFLHKIWGFLDSIGLWFDDSRLILSLPQSTFLQLLASGCILG